MFPMRAKGLPILTICPPPKRNIVPVSAKNSGVPIANISPGNTTSVSVHYVTSAIPSPVALSRSSCATPFTTVVNARPILTSICPPLHRRNPAIPTSSSNLPFASSSTMVYLIAMPVGISGEIIVFLFPSPPFKIGLRRQEKKIYTKIETDAYLDWAFKGFSGYIATDEVYDDPFCILSLVDNRTYKRLMFRVLDHAPTAEDILELLQSFRKILERRNLALHGITTDGSALYTEPVRTVFPGVRHQICEFHVKAALLNDWGNKAVLKAVTQVRRELAKTKTKRSKRGRP